MDKPSATRSWRTLAAVMVVGAAPLFGFSKYYVAAVKADMEVAQSRLDELRSGTAQAAATTARLDQLRSHVAQLEGDVDSFEKTVTARKDLAALLEAVDALAGQANLTVRRFTPQPGRQQSGYAEVAYKLVVEGRYRDLTTLFEGIGSRTPTVSVRELTISQTLEQPDEGRLRAECLLSAIILPDANAVSSLDDSSLKPQADTRDHRRAVAVERDPFTVPAKPGVEAAAEARPAGLRGLLVDDIVVKGIVQDAAGVFALFQTSDRRSFVARAGEKLSDGVVKTVTADAVVLVRTGDQRRRTGAADVVRKLRPVAGGRE